MALRIMSFYHPSLFLFRPDAKPPIPPDAKITYEIQLLSVRDGPNINNMSDEERISIGYGIQICDLEQCFSTFFRKFLPQTVLLDICNLDG